MEDSVYNVLILRRVKVLKSFILTCLCVHWNTLKEQIRNQDTDQLLPVDGVDLGIDKQGKGRVGRFCNVCLFIFLGFWIILVLLPI